MKRLILLHGLLLQSFATYASEFETIDNVISTNLEKPLVLGYTYTRFDKSLDLLNYGDKLTSTKPKEASIDTLFLSYKFKDFRFSYESLDSSGTVIRATQPKSLETNVAGKSFYFSYLVNETDKRSYELGVFAKEEKQDPVTIDCYAFGSTVIGGSCSEARLRLLNSDIYKSTGDLVYEPVLKTSGESDSQGIFLRVIPKSLNLLSFTHTISYKISDINQSFESKILNTTDSFIRGLTIDGSNAGVLLDNFKNELPQDTPWKEKTFKYALSNLIPIGQNFAASFMYSFVKVKRNEYLKNPIKEDFNKNHLLDLSFFYKVNDYGLFYMKFSASTNYLLGENPLAYNRRSNHLFDHPYGQVSAGIIVNF